MPSRTLRRLAVALVLAGLANTPFAEPGDLFVPAHRTRDGSFVPPNVAPLSGGSHLAQRPARSRARAYRAAPSRGIVSPLFVAARPIRH